MKLLFTTTFSILTLKSINAAIADYSILGDIQINVNDINNYGCWCFLDDQHGRGRGQPANSLDEICADYHKAIDCVMIDDFNETGEVDCIPWEVKYNQGNVFGNIDSIVDSCINNNPETSNCVINTCIAEGAFIINLITFSFGGNQIESATYLHDNGFDYNSNCSISGARQGQTIEKECCGSLPTRYPYNPNSGQKSCCNEVTYNSAVQQCCSDGSVGLTCDTDNGLQGESIDNGNFGGFVVDSGDTESSNGSFELGRK